MNVRVPVHRGKAHLIVPKGMRVSRVTEAVTFTGGATSTIGVGRVGDTPPIPDGPTMHFTRMSSAYQAPDEVIDVELVPKR